MPRQSSTWVAGAEGRGRGRGTRKHVVVVGAGILGVSIAYQLALGGAQVTVLDKQEPGAGCTQGAFAMIIASLPYASEEFSKLYGLAAGEWHALEAQIDEPLPTQWGGVVNWAAPGPKAEELAAQTARLERWGSKVQRLTEDDVGRLVPGAVPGAFGAGNFLSDWGAIDLHKTFEILLRRAKDLGVTFRTPLEVTGISVANSGAAVVEGGHEAIDADSVVVAAGAGSPDLTRHLGARVPLRLQSGTLAYSKPMPPTLNRVLNGPSGSIRQNPDGRIVTALDYAPGADGHDTGEAYGRALLARTVQVVPALAGIELDKVTVGHVPIPKDSQPVTGFCDPRKTIYVAVMMSGITMAPLMGRLIATEVLGQPVQLLEAYRPERFSTSKL
ncbi:uncharacterized protein PV06_07077 [Exophiala oligosperma]|uniref:FAD dependent oxidoreductase domain-containing protein n=1 Tax=Exophiala oligosperma TaxID=215243 RepID=A0A0D2BVT3_9EURO|nr:uncharacterized protein PV06_07077 [Exophiala oligosperma]KIW41527.1 hypothetical protein PV06_07077 [Exophiala oligosperma]